MPCAAPVTIATLPMKSTRRLFRQNGGGSWRFPARTRVCASGGVTIYLPPYRPPGAPAVPLRLIQALKLRGRHGVGVHADRLAEGGASDGRGVGGEAALCPVSGDRCRRHPAGAGGPHGGGRRPGDPEGD